MTTQPQTNLPEPGELSDLPPLPVPYSNIYPMNDDGMHGICFSPAYQPGNGRPNHQPVFTKQQMEAYVAADRAQRVTGLDPEMGFLLDGANVGELAAYDYAVQSHCVATLEILEDKDTGAGSCNEPWASVRKALLELVAQRVKVFTKLTDVQWMNIVNDPRILCVYDKQDAVELVFKLVEQKLEEVNTK